MEEEWGGGGGCRVNDVLWDGEENGGDGEGWEENGAMKELQIGRIMTVRWLWLQWDDDGDDDADATGDDTNVDADDDDDGDANDDDVDADDDGCDADDEDVSRQCLRSPLKWLP